MTKPTKARLREEIERILEKMENGRLEWIPPEKKYEEQNKLIKKLIGGEK